MLRKIFSRFNRILIKAKRKTIFLLNLVLSRKIKIIDSEKYGESILQLKDKSIERVYFPKIYDLTEASWIDFQYPGMDVRRYNEAQIYSSSDFIIIKDGAVWGKYFKPQWAKSIPLDKALLKVKDDYVYIKKTKHFKTIEYGYSLCGVHCTFWAHFLVQYLPKLYLLNKVLSVVNHEITVIIPTYSDSQIKEIIYTYISHLENIKIVELKQDEAAYCKVLYHVENTSYLSDHANYINPADIIIPHFTIDLLKTNLVDFYSSNEKKNRIDTQLPFRNLYIGRSGYRNIINNEEIENYFISLGFEVILPHKLTLKEKINIFNEAAIIVGPYSSGFTNILFCQAGVKALGFINFQRTFDGYVSSFAKYFGVNLMLLTGYDQNDSIHSSYSIPLEKIKLAYSDLLS